MAERYIDANKIDYTMASVYVGQYEKGNSIYRRCTIALESEIDEMPTADVVPRADLEIWKDIAHRETSYVGKAKAEVAREIFAEIKKICYPWKNPMVKMDWAKFRELEKKFTEGER